MTLSFPSPEFEDAVAAVCHGSATDAEMQGLNELLRSDARARDEYLLRVELHSRLASEPDLFPQKTETAEGVSPSVLKLNDPPRSYSPGAPARARNRKLVRTLALAACVALVAGGIWSFWLREPAERDGATSTAVAMLTHAVDARWRQGTQSVRAGSALGPGWLRLESGLAQVVFYSGARVVMEGPTELQLISPSEAACPTGRILAEVPQPAHGFRLRTTQLNVVDLGTSFGVNVSGGRTEVHVFKGKVELFTGSTARQSLDEGQAAEVQGTAAPRLKEASAAAFATMWELPERSLASEALRYDQWRDTSARLNRDTSLLVRLDFEQASSSEWTLRNTAENGGTVPEATIVGCRRAEGRWPEKQALEFQSVNDRVRLAVPGEFDSMTLACWVCVKGLDRKLNSLFMSDGFEPGTIHWLIRNDGVLGLTVMGTGIGEFQIMASAPVLTLDKFGMWTHLAVTLDGKGRRVIQYVNGTPVAHHRLKYGPPFRVGAGELGNWNARSGPKPTPFLIRNLSGSLDEFELFNRALGRTEIQDLYQRGKPQLEPERLAANR